jgi:hypothetical protein
VLSWIEDTPERVDTRDVVGARRRRGPRVVGPERTSRPQGRHAASAGGLGSAPTAILPHPSRATRAPTLRRPPTGIVAVLTRYVSALDVVRTDLPWSAYKREPELVPHVMLLVP